MSEVSSRTLIEIEAFRFYQRFENGPSPLAFFLPYSENTAWMQNNRKLCKKIIVNICSQNIKGPDIPASLRERCEGITQRALDALQSKKLCRQIFNDVLKNEFQLVFTTIIRLDFFKTQGTEMEPAASRKGLQVTHLSQGTETTISSKQSPASRVKIDGEKLLYCTVLSQSKEGLDWVALKQPTGWRQYLNQQARAGAVDVFIWIHKEAPELLENWLQSKTSPISYCHIDMLHWISGSYPKELIELSEGPYLSSFLVNFASGKSEEHLKVVQFLYPYIKEELTNWQLSLPHIGSNNLSFLSLISTEAFQWLCAQDAKIAEFGVSIIQTAIDRVSNRDHLRVTEPLLDKIPPAKLPFDLMLKVRLKVIDAHLCMPPEEGRKIALLLEHPSCTEQAVQKINQAILSPYYSYHSLVDFGIKEGVSSFLTPLKNNFPNIFEEQRKWLDPFQALAEHKGAFNAFSYRKNPMNCIIWMEKSTPEILQAAYQDETKNLLHHALDKRLFSFCRWLFKKDPQLFAKQLEKSSGNTSFIISLYKDKDCDWKADRLFKWLEEKPELQAAIAKVLSPAYPVSTWIYYLHRWPIEQHANLVQALESRYPKLYEANEPSIIEFFSSTEPSFKAKEFILQKLEAEESEVKQALRLSYRLALLRFEYNLWKATFRERGIKSVTEIFAEPKLSREEICDPVVTFYLGLAEEQNYLQACSPVQNRELRTHINIERTVSLF